MGMQRRHSGYDNSYSPPRFAPPNPDPANFVVREVHRSGNYFAAKVHYAGCTNYEGEKILVTTFNPTKVKLLDPHFEEGSGIVARFPPTRTGWATALRFIEREG